MKQEETNNSHSPLHNSSFIIHNSTAVAVYHWRGARPWLLDLDDHQTGWAITLVLTREGDCCLLPAAWLRDMPTPDDDRFPPGVPYPAAYPASFHADALDSDALTLTLADLRQDGWQVNGRLDIHFSGSQTDPDFWQHIQTYLWQTPTQKEDL